MKTTKCATSNSVSTSCSVSVVIPIYNASRTLDRTILSLISQEDVDLEIICVDDGSTDCSRKKILEWADKDSRIHYIFQSNKGAGPARNAGIEIAEGEFIAFMDPDDWLPDSHVYSGLIELARRYRVKAAGGNLSKFDRCNQKYLGLQEHPFAEGGITAYESYQFAGYYQRFIFLRSLLDEFQIRFPSYRRYQDPIFMVRALDAAGTFYATPCVTYCYSSGPQNIVWNQQKICDWCCGVEDVLCYAKSAHYQSLYNYTCDSFYDRNVLRGVAGLQDGLSESLHAYDKLMRSVDTDYLFDTRRYNKALADLDSLKRASLKGEKAVSRWASRKSSEEAVKNAIKRILKFNRVH